MSNEIELAQIAQDIQQECHASVEYVINNSESQVSVQDATNVFLYRKLAEMELRIRNLENIK
jgi:hypothetical protein